MACCILRMHAWWAPMHDMYLLDLDPWPKTFLLLLLHYYPTSSLSIVCTGESNRRFSFDMPFLLYCRRESIQRRQSKARIWVDRNTCRAARPLIIIDMGRPMASQNGLEATGPGPRPGRANSFPSWLFSSCIKKNHVTDKNNSKLWQLYEVNFIYSYGNRIDEWTISLCKGLTELIHWQLLRLDSYARELPNLSQFSLQE